MTGQRSSGTVAPVATQRRTGAVVVALAPVVLLIALFLHPYIAVLPDPPAVAESVAADTTRWGIAHLLTMLASALLALAFLAVRAYLRDLGEERFTAWGLPFVVFASVMYAFLAGLEFAPLAAAETGGDVTAVQEALTSWFVPAFVIGAVSFAIGAFAFAKGIAATGVVGRRATGAVVAALVVMAVARAVPLGIAQFYVQALAGLVALWPLAHAMWRRPEAAALSPAAPAA